MVEQATGYLKLYGYMWGREEEISKGQKAEDVNYKGSHAMCRHHGGHEWQKGNHEDRKRNRSHRSNKEEAMILQEVFTGSGIGKGHEMEVTTLKEKKSENFLLCFLTLAENNLMNLELFTWVDPREIWWGEIQLQALLAVQHTSPVCTLWQIGQEAQDR